MSDSKTFDFGEAIRLMRLGESVTCADLDGEAALSIRKGVLFLHHRTDPGIGVDWHPDPCLNVFLMSNKWSVVDRSKVYVVRYYDRDGNFLEEGEIRCSGDQDVRHAVSSVIKLGSNKYWQASVKGDGVDCLVLE